MSFRPEAVSVFLELFNETADKIKASDGCLELSIFSDCSSPAVLFTISRWENEAALDNYRNSELFTNTWSRTKPLFAEKAKAWSLERLAR
jgi:quinol monooxygenase YgiN